MKIWGGKQSGNIFCRDCKWFMPLKAECNHPNNIVQRKTWKGIEKEVDKYPWIKNIDNNCKDYEGIK